MSNFGATKYIPIPVTVLSGVADLPTPVGSTASTCCQSVNTGLITNPYIVDQIYQNNHFLIVDYAFIPSTLGITPTTTVIGAFWVNNVYFGSGLSTDPVPSTYPTFGGKQTGQILDPAVGINNLEFYTDSLFYINRVFNTTTSTYTYYGVFQKFQTDPTITSSPFFPFFYIKAAPNQTVTFVNTPKQSTKLVIESNLITSSVLSQTLTSVVLNNLDYNNTVPFDPYRNNGTPISFVVIPNTMIRLYGTVRSKRVYVVIYNMTLNLSFDSRNDPVLQSPDVSLNQIMFNFISANDIISGEPAPVRLFPSGLRFQFSAITNSDNYTANMISRYLANSQETAEFLVSIGKGNESTVYTTKLNNIDGETMSTTYTSNIVYDPINNSFIFNTTLTYSPFAYDVTNPGSMDNSLTIQMEIEYD